MYNKITILVSPCEYGKQTCVASARVITKIFLTPTSWVNWIDQFFSLTSQVNWIEVFFSRTSIMNWITASTFLTDLESELDDVFTSSHLSFIPLKKMTLPPCWVAWQLQVTMARNTVTTNFQSRGKIFQRSQRKIKKLSKKYSDIHLICQKTGNYSKTLCIHMWNLQYTVKKVKFASKKDC